ncbi:MAG: molecular chaperone TorD family protein [Thermodesulfobacteriota bacterium]
MRFEDFFIRESARCNAYMGLADCYYLPDEGLTRRLKTLENHVGRLGSEALSHVLLMRSKVQAGKELEALKVEFAKLFVGPYKLLAPPYGSVYLEGGRKVMGNSTMNVKEHYRNAGLDIADNFMDAPDHIAVELEFMHFLVFKEVDSIQKKDPEKAIERLYNQKLFLETHLGAWVPDFCGEVERQAKDDFYHHLAVATRLFIAEEMEYIHKFEVEELSKGMV